MSLLKIVAAGFCVLSLSACTSPISSYTPDFSGIFGRPALPSQVAGSRPDGSLAPGVGRTGRETSRGLSSAETEAEKRNIEKDIPYAVSRP